MSDKIVNVNVQETKTSLLDFVRGVGRRDPLLKEIAAGMYASVRRTFREQGSPADSWAPLADSTRSKAGSKASAGRKILIVSGRLLNSIKAVLTNTGVAIGTNLVYARVQQLGSADRGAGEGPQARIPGRGVTVGAHSRSTLREIHYGTREVLKGDKVHHIPVAMKSGIHEIKDKHGRTRNVSGNFQGPKQKLTSAVGEHERHQNIPARPYLVLRPEDMPRIRAQVIAFGVRAAVNAGLKATGGR